MILHRKKRENVRTCAEFCRFGSFEVEKVLVFVPFESSNTESIQGKLKEKLRVARIIENVRKSMPDVPPCTEEEKCNFWKKF